MLSVIYWDPSRAIIPWNIPIINRPILWYGFFFALGFFLAYYFLVYLLKCYFDQDSELKKIKKNKKGKDPTHYERAKHVAEKALLYSVVGTITGARLGDVIFYQDWHLIIKDPFSIFKIWEGGLASHGGAVGVVIAFWLFFKRIKPEYPSLSFLKVMDLVCVPVAMVGGFIRLGNFFNQEILGTKSDLFFAVVFGHPADGSIPVPRHPVQLYESLWYFVVSIFLYKIWNKDHSLKNQGRVFSLFLILVFGFRMLIECVKEEQTSFQNYSWMSMGQWLSIPFIIMGFILLWKGRKSR
jgi:phosphatidylglycerol---prolipoprotein diacylglyceryl transferase